jgi:hypothetical protein
MTIRIDQLPAPKAISNKPIRQAAEDLALARIAENEARRSLVELEQTREQALQADAEEDAAARAATGKPKSTRTHTAAHDKATEKAAHEARVAKVALGEAEERLEDAIEAHSPAWAAEAAKDEESLHALFVATLKTLTELYGKWKAARATLKLLGDKCTGIGMVEFDLRQLNGIEIAQGARRKADIYAEDLLDGLSRLGELKPEPQVSAPANIPSWSPSARGMTGVEEEVAERRAYEAAHGIENNAQ